MFNETFLRWQQLKFLRSDNKISSVNVGDVNSLFLGLRIVSKLPRKTTSSIHNYHQQPASSRDDTRNYASFNKFHDKFSIVPRGGGKSFCSSVADIALLCCQRRRLSTHSRFHRQTTTSTTETFSWNLNKLSQLFLLFLLEQICNFSISVCPPSSTLFFRSCSNNHFSGGWDGRWNDIRRAERTWWNRVKWVKEREKNSSQTKMEEFLTF